MKLSKAQTKESTTAIWEKMEAGKTDGEIMTAMGLDVETYIKLKATTLDDKANELRQRPSEHVYIEYIMNQGQNLRDLTTMIKDFKTTKQHTAMVAAVKARSDIYDKMVARGQEFGIIHKEADKKQIGVGVLVAQLTSKKLQAAITGELKFLNDMMKTYGDKSIIDVTPGQIHHGPILPAAQFDSPDSAVLPMKPKILTGEYRSTSNTVKANTSRRSAGRKVVLPKARLSVR